MTHSMPLPGPSSPQVSRCGRRAGAPDASGRRRTRSSGAPCGMTFDLGRVDRVAGEQPVAGGAGHGHDRAGGGHDLLQHLALVRGRLDEHGVQHHDDRHGEPLAARRGPARRRCRRRCRTRAGRPPRRTRSGPRGRGLPPAGRARVDQVCTTSGPGPLVVSRVDDPHDADRAVAVAELGGEGGVEGRQPAFGSAGGC